MVPDYYAMLGVDPSADRAAVEAALSRCQPVWSSGTRNPKTKHTYQSYLDQIPAIRQALLGDPSSRVAYDAEIAAVRRAERDAKLDALQKLIRLRAAKGGLTVSDRKLLRDEAVRLGLTAADLDRLAEPIPPKPESPAARHDDAPEPAPDVVDPVMRRQIRVALDHLRKRDLYDALGVARDAPPWEVAERADAERQRWMKKTQVTAEKTAWLELVTLAQSHLGSPSSRSRYDRTLQYEAEEGLNQAIAFALKGLPSLDPGTRALLLDMGSAAGIGPARAGTLVDRGCRTLGISLNGNALGGSAILSAGGAPARLLRCRSCQGVTDFAVVARSTPADCRHCRASLHWTCPVCQRSHWVDQPRCTCGFRVDLREPLVRHFEAAQHAFRAKDYAGAVAHLRRVQEMAPRHVGARKGVERIKARVAEVDATRAALEVARGGSKLVEAKRAVTAWGRLVDPASPEWRAAYTEVTRGLRDAQALAAKARARERTDPRAARDLYRRSLALASDLAEASQGLNRCPPDPPSNLSAWYAEDRVKLRWSPPPPDGLGPVRYVILRKPDALPTHPGDGVRIGESTVPEFEDPGATPGTSAAYSVLTRRGEVESVAAVAVGPVFLMGEVQNVRVDSRSREVDLSWTPPRGASEVRVVRKRGSPPHGPTDGDRVESTLDQAHERHLESDRIYHFGIYAIYRMPDGRSTSSRGVIVSAQPHTPVHALGAPSVTPEPDGRVTLRWVEPARGIVKLVRTSRPFPHAPGTRLAPVQVANLEGDWVEVSLPDQAVDTPPAAGVCYYTPLTAWGGHVTVGHPAMFSCIADPSDLRASRAANGQAHLRWRWSPHGAQSLVVLKSGSPPTGPDDPSARVETVHEADYARFGRHAVTVPSDEPGPWHAAVYALASAEGLPVTSPGLEPSARTVVPGPNQEVALSYSFRKGRLTGRKWTVSFRTEPAGATIPPTVLVGHDRTVPLSADDGSILASFPAAQDGATFPLPGGLNLARSRARIFADPRSEPDQQAPIRLRHPEADATRV